MTLVSKNVYIDKLNEMPNEYSNIYHSTIQRKPVDVESSGYTDFDKRITQKILNSKFLIMLEYQNTKAFLLKDILLIRLKKLL